MAKFEEFKTLDGNYGINFDNVEIVNYRGEVTQSGTGKKWLQIDVQFISGRSKALRTNSFVEYESWKTKFQR